MREALTTSTRLQLPYRIESDGLIEKARALRLPEMIADVFREPEVIVARAAASATYLVTVIDHDAVVGFMFARRDRLSGQKAAAVCLIGVDPSHSVGSTAGTLLSSIDDVFGSTAALAYTATAQPKLERLWGQHFGDRCVDDISAALGSELWGMLGGIADPGDPAISRGQFPDEFTPSELVHIKRSNRVYAARCARLDAGAGDRRLLVARV